MREVMNDPNSPKLCVAYAVLKYKSKYKKVGVLPVYASSNVFSEDSLSKRNVGLCQRKMLNFCIP